MKKIFCCLLLMCCVFTGCAQEKSYEISLVIPAGSTQKFVYSDQEISPSKDKIIISADVGDTEVLLLPLVHDDVEVMPVYLTNGMPAEVSGEKGKWYAIGINIQNPTDEEIVVTCTVKNVAEIRIPQKGEIFQTVQLRTMYLDGIICYEIDNYTDQKLHVYDASFRLEKKMDDEWVKVENKGVSFCGNASSLKANDTYGPVPFEEWYETLEHGEYRVSIVVSEESTDTRLYSEFVK